MASAVAVSASPEVAGPHLGPALARGGCRCARRVHSTTWARPTKEQVEGADVVEVFVGVGRKLVEDVTHGVEARALLLIRT